MQKKSIITLKRKIKKKNNKFRFALNNNNHDNDDNNHLNVRHDVIFPNVIILNILQPRSGSVVFSNRSR